VRAEVELRLEAVTVPDFPVADLRLSLLGRRPGPGPEMAVLRWLTLRAAKIRHLLRCRGALI